MLSARKQLDVITAYRQVGTYRGAAEICGVAACFMSRNSYHAAHLCKECTDICNECAESCEKIAGGDAMMKQCAEACRRCAASPGLAWRRFTRWA